VVSDPDAAVARSEPPPVEDAGPPGDDPPPPEFPPPGLLPLGASPCPPSELFGALPSELVGALLSGLVGVLPSVGLFAGELGVDALTSPVDTLTVGVDTPTSGVFRLTPGSETPTLGTVTSTLGTVTPMLGTVIPTLGSDSPILGSAAETLGSDSPPAPLPSESRPCASATPPMQSDTQTPTSGAASAARTRLACQALNSRRARAERALTRVPSTGGRSCCQSQRTAARRPLRAPSAQTHARDQRPWRRSAHIPRTCRSRARQTSTARRPCSR
jgi:hypothetical protein